MPFIKAKITVLRDVELEVPSDAAVELPGILRQQDHLAPNDQLSSIQVTYCDSHAGFLPVLDNIPAETWDAAVRRLQTAFRSRDVSGSSFERDVPTSTSRARSQERAVSLLTSSAALTAPTTRCPSPPDYYGAQPTSDLISPDSYSVQPFSAQPTTATNPLPRNSWPPRLFNAPASILQTNDRRKSDRTLRYEARTCQAEERYKNDSKLDRNVTRRLRQAMTRGATKEEDRVDQEVLASQNYKPKIRDALKKRKIDNRVNKHKRKDERRFAIHLETHGVTQALKFQQQRRQTFRQMIKQEVDNKRWAPGTGEDAKMDIITNSIKGLATKSSEDSGGGENDGLVAAK